MRDPSPSDLDMPAAADPVSAESRPAAQAPRVLLLGPARSAVSGVSTHLNQLFGSALSGRFRLMQFQVGSEGRGESRAGTLLRLAYSPIAFAACLVRSRPRIVHINTSLEPKSYWRDLVYLLTAKLLRKKIVYQVHGGALPAEFFSGKPVLTGLLRTALSWADRVVLLARCEMRAYAAFAPSARLVLIANAVQADDSDLTAERYAPSRPLKLVYMGRLAAEKGVLDAVCAVRILRERGVWVNLTIAGSGPAADEITRLIEAGGLADRVQLVAPVFGSAKQSLWRESHVFVFPTYHREGLPYALLEALASGTVPVVSPVGAIPDVVEDGVHGLFVPSRNPAGVADAVQRLASDRALLHRLATAGRARVLNDYSVAHMASQFDALYASLVS